MRLSLSTLLAFSALAVAAPGAGAESFADTTPGTTVFVVPAGVDSLGISATGGAGGNLIGATGAILVPGGRAALVTGRVKVFPGERLQLIVGAGGGDGNSSTGASGKGGAPDGGPGGFSAGGGGGATRILGCEGVICPVAVVAAGGGGAGSSGFVSASPSFPVLPGGAGGDAGAAGGSGASDPPVNGGGGGQPGTAGKGGAGGAGFHSGGSGGIPTGGAGGNQGAYEGHEGGGGGGAGVFGGGGGGSGSSGMDAALNQAVAGGGGGGGGSSLAPSGANLNLAKAGAAPGIVLTWVAPGGPGSGPGPSGRGGPALTKLAISPAAFPASASGPSALPIASHRKGARVTYTLDQAAGVRFRVLERLPGRRAKGGKCARPTAANGSGRKCIRDVPLAGGFTQPGAAGANGFRFSGRLAGHKLAPGRYRLLATASAGGKTGQAARASFRIAG